MSVLRGPLQRTHHNPQYAQREAERTVCSNPATMLLLWVTSCSSILRGQVGGGGGLGSKTALMAAKRVPCDEVQVS